MSMEDPNLEEAEGEPLPEEASSNRTFIIIAIALGGMLVLGFVLIIVFAVFVRPGQQNAQSTRVASINATNSAIQATNSAIDTQAAIPTNTPVPTATETPAPTDTPAPTATFTETPVPVATTEAAVTETPGTPGTPVTGTPGVPGGGQAVTPSPTRLGGATPTRTTTPLVGALTRTLAPGQLTPTSTALPATGFADESNVPALIVIAAGLVAVVIIARRLRLGLK